MSKITQVIIPIEIFYSSLGTRILRRFDYKGLGAIAVLAAEQYNGMDEIRLEVANEVISGCGLCPSEFIDFLVSEGVADVAKEHLSLHFAQCHCERYIEKCKINKANISKRIYTTRKRVVNHSHTNELVLVLESELDLDLESNNAPAREGTTTPDEAERAFEEALATVQAPPQQLTKTSKTSPTRLSGAAKMERKQAAIQRLIDQTSKPLWFTGSESIIELRRFLEICQAKKKIPKFASTVAGWLAQYESLDHFLMAVQLSIKNEWCTLLRYSDVVRYSGGDKKADRSEEIKKSFWNLRDQLAGDEVYEKN